MKPRQPAGPSPGRSKSPGGAKKQRSRAAAQAAPTSAQQSSSRSPERPPAARQRSLQQKKLSIKNIRKLKPDSKQRSALNLTAAQKKANPTPKKQKRLDIQAPAAGRLTSQEKVDKFSSVQAGARDGEADTLSQGQQQPGPAGLRQKLEEVVQKGLQGIPAKGAATATSGHCDVDMREARTAMMELIHEIAPGMHVAVSALEKKAEAKKIRESQKSLNRYRRALVKKSTRRTPSIARVKSSESAHAKATVQGQAPNGRASANDKEGSPSGGTSALGGGGKKTSLKAQPVPQSPSIKAEASPNEVAEAPAEELQPPSLAPEAVQGTSGVPYSQVQLPLALGNTTEESAGAAENSSVTVEKAPDAGARRARLLEVPKARKSETDSSASRSSSPDPSSPSGKSGASNNSSTSGTAQKLSSIRSAGAAEDSQSMNQSINHSSHAAARSDHKRSEVTSREENKSHTEATVREHPTAKPLKSKPKKAGSAGEALLSQGGGSRSPKNRSDDDEAAADRAKPVHRRKRKAKKVQVLGEEVEEMPDMPSLDGSVGSRDSVSQSSQSLNSEHAELKRINATLHANSPPAGRDAERKPKLDAKYSSDEAHGSALKVNEEAEESKEQHEDETSRKEARRGNSKKSSTQSKTRAAKELRAKEAQLSEDEAGEAQRHLPSREPSAEADREASKGHARRKAREGERPAKKRSESAVNVFNPPPPEAGLPEDPAPLRGSHRAPKGPKLITMKTHSKKQRKAPKASEHIGDKPTFILQLFDLLGEADKLALAKQLWASVSPPPICIIQRELDTLSKARFSSKLTEAQGTLATNKADFKMLAIQIQELQQIVAKNVKTDIDYADVQDLFEPNLDAFFAILNQKLIKFNQWQEIEEFVNEHLANVPNVPDEDVSMSGRAAAAAGGTLSSATPAAQSLLCLSSSGPVAPKWQRSDALTQKGQGANSARQKKKKTQNSTVELADMLMPTFNEDGTLQGFQIRAHLAILMYIQNDYDLTPLKRTVAVALQMNYMLREGAHQDFSVEDASRAAPQTAQATLVDAGPLQVEMELLEPTPLEASTKNITKILCDHLVDVHFRARSGAKALFKLSMAEKTLADLCGFKLTNIFEDEASHQEQLQPTETGEAPDEECVCFEDYLNLMLKKVTRYILGMDAEAKAVILLDEFAFKAPSTMLGPTSQNINSWGKEQSWQPVHDVVVAVGAAKNKLTLRQRPQEVLDDALEEEFGKTIEAMDEFVDQYGALETDDELLAIKKQEIAKKKEDSLRPAQARAYIRDTIPSHLQVNDLPQLKLKIHHFSSKVKEDLQDPARQSVVGAHLDGFKSAHQQQAHTHGQNSPTATPLNMGTMEQAHQSPVQDLLRVRQGLDFGLHGLVRGRHTLEQSALLSPQSYFQSPLTPQYSAIQPSDGTSNLNNLHAPIRPSMLARSPQQQREHQPMAKNYSSISQAKGGNDNEQHLRTGQLYPQKSLGIASQDRTKKFVQKMQSSDITSWVGHLASRTSQGFNQKSNQDTNHTNQHERLYGMIEESNCTLQGRKVKQSRRVDSTIPKLLLGSPKTKASLLVLPKRKSKNKTRDTSATEENSLFSPSQLPASRHQVYQTGRLDQGFTAQAMRTQVRTRRAIEQSRTSVQVETKGSSELNSPLSLTVDDRVIPPHYAYDAYETLNTTSGPVYPPDLEKLPDAMVQRTLKAQRYNRGKVSKSINATLNEELRKQRTTPRSLPKV